MARHSRRQVLLLISLGAAVVSGCRAPWSRVQEDVGRYVNEMRQPLARFTAWLSGIGQFYQDAKAGDLFAVACSSGRLTALIDEGNASVTALEAVQPPSAIAGIQNKVVEGGKDLVTKLTNLRTLLCENQNVQAARTALDEIGTAVNAAKGWLDKLSGWLREQ